MVESFDKLGLGLLMGLIFGFLLQKGQVAKTRVIVGQFLLRDWTVAKIMLTAIVVGSIGVYAQVIWNQAPLHIKPALLGGVLGGGLLFGIGMVLLGYCPGTCVAACGAGHRDAWAGLVGMLLGSVVFVVAYPALKPLIKGLGDWGKITLPEVTGTSPWLWIGGLAALAIVAVVIWKRMERPRTPA